MPVGGFDTESMVGKGATLNIIHKTSQKGREYADISAIMPIMAGMEAQEGEEFRQGGHYGAKSTEIRGALLQ